MAHYRTDGANLKTVDIRNRLDALQEIISRMEEGNNRMRNRAIDLMILSETGRQQIRGHGPDRRRKYRSYRAADIKSDLRALDWAELNEKDMLKDAEDGFELKYELSSKAYRPFIRDAPEVIIQTVNRKCDLKISPCHMHSHQRKEVNEMKAVCEDIIDLWKGWNAIPLSDEIKTKVAQLNQLHRCWKKQENAEKVDGGRTHSS